MAFDSFTNLESLLFLSQNEPNRVYDNINSDYCDTIAKFKNRKTGQSKTASSVKEYWVAISSSKMLHEMVTGTRATTKKIDSVVQKK